jgi:hypothetical protein
MGKEYDERQMSAAELNRIQRERIRGEDADFRWAEKQYAARDRANQQSGKTK